MAINYTPTPAELVDLMEDWSEHPATFQTELINELNTQFPSLTDLEIQAIVDITISDGAADADDLESWYITVVSGIIANNATISTILNHVVATGTPTTISNVTSAVNAIYANVVELDLANQTLTHLNAAILTYNSNFASIGAAIGVAPAQQIIDDLNGAVADLNTLIALL